MMGVQGVPFAAGTPAEPDVWPPVACFVYFPAAAFHYGHFGEKPVKRRFVRFHTARQTGVQPCDFQAGKGFEFFQMLVHFRKFPAGVEKHDVFHGFAAFQKHEQHGCAVLAAR